MPAQARDHVIARRMREVLALEGTAIAARRLARVPDTVPSCHECNGLAGARLFDSVSAKRVWIKARLRERYAKLLETPNWTEAELQELGYALRTSVVRAQETKRVVQARLYWPRGFGPVGPRTPARSPAPRPLPKLPPPPAETRLCACGCGTDLNALGKRRDARYASGAHRARTRNGKCPEAPPRRSPKPSGLQISYRKAVNAVAAMLERELGYGPGAAQSKAALILRPALSDRQRAQLDERS